MTTYPAWTPASRPGIIPLHPLSFGTILGRSFAALRQNPRVLLGFALGVQTLGYVLVLLGVGAVAWATFSRLDTVPTGSDDFDAIMAGSIALTAAAGLVLGLAASALSVIVQAIVVSEVTHAAVAEKLRLGALWRHVRPVIWRLIGYTLLLVLVLMVATAIIVGLLVLVGLAVLPLAIILGVLVFLAAIPLVLWLTAKLLLVPAVIIIENATIRQAIPRSWRLVRTRFWVTLGTYLIISLVFGTIAQAISVPFSLLTSGLTTIISPTGDPDISTLIGILIASVLVQIVTLLIQSISLVVLSTATALIYIDCRMRHEGLDLDLLSYVEQRDAGATGLPDPYRQNIGRAIAPRPPQGYTPPLGYAPQQFVPAPPPGYPVAGAPAASPQSVTEPGPNRWTAPGADEKKIDPQSPWS